VEDAHFSSKSCLWETPQYLFDELNAEFHFDLDPCATKENAKCSVFFTTEENGLLQDWSGTVFMNPPYGKWGTNLTCGCPTHNIAKWVKKAYQESRRGITTVCLLPARTDTSWWHLFVLEASEIRFVRGRLKFGDSDNSAPFPSAIVVFRG
jgi:site-specific DNA-methyltransferase (adenine-specific)